MLEQFFTLLEFPVYYYYFMNILEHYGAYIIDVGSCDFLCIEDKDYSFIYVLFCVFS